METIQLSLETMNGGDTVREFNEELQKALEDVMDTAKPATKARTITLTASIVPNEKRTSFAYQAKVKLSLPGLVGSGGEAYLAMTGDGVIATVIDPRQMELPYQEKQPESQTEETPHSLKILPDLNEAAGSQS